MNSISHSLTELSTAGTTAHFEIRNAFANVNRQHQRVLATAFVVGVHAFLLFGLIEGLVPRPASERTEASIALVGGPLGEAVERPPPVDLPLPVTANVAPPEIDLATNVVGETSPQPSGSSLVTRPAMALASAHDFPTLPTSYAGKDNVLVHLVLSIAKDGSIARAEIAETCGFASLDQLALAWVKRNWRYQPALLNGEAVAVTTTAVVVFRAT
jgi:TonB family protein